MQIVIDISEDDLNFIKDMFAYGEIPDEKDLKETTYYAIANGIVLPKGHDALIERAQVTNYDNLYDVPAVIEADKTESGEQWQD